MAAGWGELLCKEGSSPHPGSHLATLDVSPTLPLQGRVKRARCFCVLWLLLLLFCLRHRREVDLVGRFVFALDVEEGERAQRLRPVFRPQGAERLSDFAAVMRTVHGDQGIERMIAERSCEPELLCGRRNCVLDGGCA